MKKLFILYVLLCFCLLNYAQSYEDYPKVSKIGYTTKYSNGQFNSAQYYQGAYNPSQSSSSGSRPGGQPRRVRGYDENGNPFDTDGKGILDFIAITIQTTRSLNNLIRIGNIKLNSNLSDMCYLIFSKQLDRFLI